MSSELFRNFRDERSALLFVQRRLWRGGPVCPHCGASEHVGRLRGQSTQLGSYKCYDCRKVFTVKSSTFFESSHIPLYKWLQAIFLCGCEQISASQLSEILGVSFKTAAFMIDRIRYSSSSNASNEWDKVYEERREGHQRSDVYQEQLIDEAREHAVQNRCAADDQFDRFLETANRYRQAALADKFESTFARVAKTRLKLRTWRELERIHTV